MSAAVAPAELVALLRQQAKRLPLADAHRLLLEAQELRGETLIAAQIVRRELLARSVQSSTA